MRASHQESCGVCHQVVCGCPKKPEAGEAKHTCGGFAPAYDCLGCFPPPNHEEALEIAQRYIDCAFQNEGRERPRHSIPARPDYDDDLRLTAYIRHQRDCFVPAASLAAAEARVRQFQRCADALEQLANGDPVECIVASPGELTYECDATSPCLACRARSRVAAAEARIQEEDVRAQEWMDTADQLRRDLASERAGRERLAEKWLKDAIGIREGDGVTAAAEAIESCVAELWDEFGDTPAPPSEGPASPVAEYCEQFRDHDGRYDEICGLPMPCLKHAALRSQPTPTGEAKDVIVDGKPDGAPGEPGGSQDGVAPTAQQTGHLSSPVAPAAEGEPSGVTHHKAICTRNCCCLACDLHCDCGAARSEHHHVACRLRQPCTARIAEPPPASPPASGFTLGQTVRFKGKPYLGLAEIKTLGPGWASVARPPTSLHYERVSLSIIEPAVSGMPEEPASDASGEKPKWLTDCLCADCCKARRAELGDERADAEEEKARTLAHVIFGNPAQQPPPSGQGPTEALTIGDVATRKALAAEGPWSDEAGVSALRVLIGNALAYAGELPSMVAHDADWSEIRHHVGHVEYELKEIQHVLDRKAAHELAKGADK